MKKRNNVSEVTRRRRRPGDKEKLVITYSDWSLSVTWGLSTKELFVFLWEVVPTIIETLISKIEDEDGGKFMKILLLTLIDWKVKDLLPDLEDDSDDDD